MNILTKSMRSRVILSQDANIKRIYISFRSHGYTNPVACPFSRALSREIRVNEMHIEWNERHISISDNALAFIMQIAVVARKFNAAKNCARNNGSTTMNLARADVYSRI